MNDPVDMAKLVKNLPSRPRGRACIVLTHEYDGQKEWAAELARQTDSGHIDLLELFATRPELSQKIGQFNVSGLFRLLADLKNSPFSIHNSSFIISNMEFLKATWTGQSNVTEQFASHVETWNQSPCLLFVLQYDKTLATREFRRFRQYTFVVDQKETLKL